MKTMENTKFKPNILAFLLQNNNKSTENTAAF